MFEVALHRKRIPKSIQSTFLLTPLRLKLKKIQGLFKNLHRILRTFQGKMEFKDFSRTPPKIQGLFKTVRTLILYVRCRDGVSAGRWRPGASPFLRLVLSAGHVQRMKIPE